MRSDEELWVVRVVNLANSLVARIDAFPKSGLMWDSNGKLVADVRDLHDFLLQVEKVVDELEERKAEENPHKVSPDQLTLF